MTNMTNMTSRKGPQNATVHLSTYLHSFFLGEISHPVAAPGEELSSELQRLGEALPDREKKHAINQTCL